MRRLAAIFVLVTAAHSQSVPDAQSAHLQGRVLFPDGTPAAGAQVLLLVQPNAGASTLKTDEQGRFEYKDLIRGRFVICATAPKSAKALPGESWAPTFFPNAIEKSAAQVLQLKFGADLSGYDIRLRSVPVYRIHGVVRDDRGKPTKAAIEMIASDGPRAVEQVVISADDGSFTVEGVRAGEWRLYAHVKLGGVELKAIDTVMVKRSDLDRVTIRLDHPFDLPATGSVFLMGQPPRESLGVTAVKDQNGNMVVKNIYPGRYLIVPVGMKPGVYVESVKLGERDVFGQIVDLVEGSQPIRVIYQDGAPAAHVHVDRGASSKVVFIPADEALLNEQFLRNCMANNDGRCEIVNLRPGDYYAFAFDRFDQWSLQDPEFVRTLTPSAEKVHVEKGETASVDLKVTKWPE
jgi:hypothetical protein